MFTETIANTDKNSSTGFINLYRFGFNGQEMDNEITGVTGSYLNYKFREYDSRIARFFAVDPITKDYPELTPYQHSSLNPIWKIEIEGLEGQPSTEIKNSKDDLPTGYTSAKSTTYLPPPTIIDPQNLPQNSTSEKAFPTPSGQNVGLNVSISPGYKNTTLTDIKVLSTENQNSSQGQGKIIEQTDNTLNLLMFGGGTQTTTKVLWKTANVYDPNTGKAISTNQDIPSVVMQKVSSANIGVFGVQTREVYVNGVKQVYQYRPVLTVPFVKAKVGSVGANASLILQPNYLNVRR